MALPDNMGMLIVIVLGIIIAIVGLYYWQARKVNLTRPTSPDQMPDWLKSIPPPETVAATQADGEGITLYNYDEGERVAAPFAEQIEDILHAQLKADPAMAGLKVDLGTANDGSLEIWVDGQHYTEIADIPNEQLRQAFQEAIDQWQAYHEPEKGPPATDE